MSSKPMNSDHACLDSPDMECLARLKVLSLPELLNKIFHHFDIQTKGRAAQVSHMWHDVIDHPLLWNKVTVCIRFNEATYPRYIITRKDLSWTGRGSSQPFCQAFSTLTKVIIRSAIDKTISLVALRFRKLVSLRICTSTQGYNEVSDLSLTLISANLKSLRHLDLWGCKHVTDIGLAALCGWNGETSDGNVPVLQSLSLSGIDGLTYEAFRFLRAGQPVLQWLNLSRSCNHKPFLGTNLLGHLKVVHFGMAHLGQMVKLSYLDLSYTLISAAGLKLLAPYEDSRLTNLSLNSCAQVDDRCGQALARLTHLTMLDLGYTRVGNTVLHCLADGASALDTLILKCCRRVNDEAGQHLARMRNLRVVDLICTSIGDAGLCHLANEVDSRLETILISKSDIVTEAGLERVARLPRLRRLQH